MKKLVLLMAICSLQALAGTQFLLKATNDEDSETTKLHLDLNQQNDILGLIKETYDAQGELTKKPEYFGLESEEVSIVLDHRNSRNILSLTSENFSQYNGGDLELVYLYNGATGSVLSLGVDLLRNGDQWSVAINGEDVSHLHLVSRRLFGYGTVGIKYIKVVE